MKLAQIATALGAKLENGSPDMEITGVAGIKEAGPGQLTFVANPKYAGAARTTKASAVIVAEEFPAIAARMLRRARRWVGRRRGGGGRGRPFGPLVYSSTRTSKLAGTPSCWRM